MNKLVGMVQNTNRGRDKSNEDEIKSLIETIESMPSSETVEEKLNLLRGKWDLLWTNDDVTRASPFFWAFRKATRDIKDPVGVVGPELISESIFQITDSIPFKSIGSCSQTFTSDGRLVSEVDVEIGLQSILSVGSSKVRVLFLIFLISILRLRIFIISILRLRIHFHFNFFIMRCVNYYSLLSY